MNDGNMGSITFDLNGTERREADLVEAHYNDSDNQIVIITLTLDEKNELFELDFWKTDFSELKSYPKPHELIIKQSY